MTLHPSFSRKKLQNTPVGLSTRSAKLASSAAPEPSEPIWINCRQPVFAIGLEQMLKKELLIHRGQQPPKGDVLSAIVLYAGGVEGIAESVERMREANPDLPVLVFSSHVDLSLAYAALKSGARGFAHAGMTSDQILRALRVALKGEIVAPGEAARVRVGR